MSEQKVYLLRSKDLNNEGTGVKVPVPENLGYGELAMNYRNGKEVLAIKNDNDEIATFSSDNIYNDIISGLLNQIKSLNEQINGLNDKIDDLSYDLSKRNFLRFNIESDGIIPFDTAPGNQIYYKKNGGDWTLANSNISVRANDVVIFKGDNESLASDGLFTNVTCRYSVEGNIMSIIDSEYFAEKNTITEPGMFSAMFENSTGLTSAKNLILPATTLRDECYEKMFNGCISLVEAPSVLPATTLAEYCYFSMFMGCTSLTTAPELPVTAFTDAACYARMFEDCTSLINAPKLPATILGIGCYRQMFQNCTSLVEAPELPATVLRENCYESMFAGCQNLNYIKCLATDISAQDCTSGWMQGVAENGTFVKAPTMTGWTIGTNGIPTGWIIEDYSKRYLTFRALERGTFKFSGSTTANTLSYSLDNGNTWVALAHNTDTPTVSSGSTIMWKGTGLTIEQWGGIGKFVSTGRYEVEGNIMSLTHGDNFTTATTIQNYGFSSLFNSSTGLTSAENLVLPATTLASYCYYYMFRGCSSLTIAPELPATTLANYCYTSMFNGCTSLTQAPELPVTTLADNCYYYMFAGCTSLTKAPELPATTLTQRCYSMMFDGCTSLTKAPELPATTLAQQCYSNMFYGCRSLNYIKCLATNISASGCVNSWVYGVAASGTFVKATGMTDWTTGNNGIPNNWTVENA